MEDFVSFLPRRSNEFSSITRAFKALSLSLSWRVQGEGEGREHALCSRPCSTRREIVDESAYIRSAESTDMRGGTIAKVKRGKAKTAKERGGGGREGEKPFVVVALRTMQMLFEPS